MALPRIWWLDDYDCEEARNKLASVRSQLSEWDWIRFSDDEYEGTKEVAGAAACKALCTELGVGSMFYKGKVVYTYGIPKYETTIAKSIQSGDLFVPSTSMFVIVAEISKSSAIYKALNAGDKSLVDTKVATITKTHRLGKNEAVNWIVSKAEEKKFKMDVHAAEMMVDIVGINPNRLKMELEKLTLLAPGDTIHPWVVEQGCCGEGESEIIEMCSSILANNKPKAHELLGRVLLKDDKIKTMAFLRSWMTRMAIAECMPSLDAESRKRVLAAKRWRPGEGKGVSVPMFANPASLDYARKDLASANRKPEWALRGLLRMRDLDTLLKISKPFWITQPSGDRLCIFPQSNKEEIMHDFVESLMA